MIQLNAQHTQLSQAKIEVRVSDMENLSGCYRSTQQVWLIQTILKPQLGSQPIIEKRCRITSDGIDDSRKHIGVNLQFCIYQGYLSTPPLGQICSRTQDRTNLQNWVESLLGSISSFTGFIPDGLDLLFYLVHFIKVAAAFMVRYLCKMEQEKRSKS